ncbi:MAG: hypothetical protein BGO41_15770 [Clostridiales bacterium 38-18]|nr:MAG: hypothetical protein BGO41_15770 [Clostridiales bacterium 38-18]
MEIVIKNGRVIDPKTGRDEIMDLLIVDDKIACIQAQISTDQREVIDANGMIVSPGFIDLHVHLREPGFEFKETIYTGSRACAKGGYTSVFCMPNTKPALDTKETLQALKERIQKDSVIGIYPVGAITQGIKGEVLTDHSELYLSGVKALSDDGRTTMNPDHMRKAFEASKKLNIPVMTHSEDHDLTERLKGEIYPPKAEYEIVYRDINLCAEVGGKLHVSHVSTKEAANAINEARTNHVKVTCEVAPHHFALSDKNVDMTSTLSKVNPPIRSEEDRKAMIAAIKLGWVDAIATDHAPHEASSKETNYENASFGISGIETAFGVSYQTLVIDENIPLIKVLSLLTYQPAQIGGLENEGVIEAGYYANLVILDLESKWQVISNQFISKGKNTPFEGMQLQGEVVRTIYRGKTVYER